MSDSATLMGSKVVLGTKSEPSTSHSILARPEPHMTCLQNRPSNSTKAIHGQRVTSAVRPFQTPSKADFPFSLPSLSVPSFKLDRHSEINTSSSSTQIDPSNSIKAVLGNQTALALDPNATSTASTGAQTPTMTKNVSGVTTMLPHINEVGRSG